MEQVSLFNRVFSHTARDSSGKADSRLPTLLLIVFMAGSAYIGWSFFFPWFKNWMLTDFIKSRASWNGMTHSKPTEESIRTDILQKLKELGILWRGPNDQEILEIIPQNNLAFLIRLRYKQTIKIEGFNPITNWYEIKFDGTQMATSAIPKSSLDKALQ